MPFLRVNTKYRPSKLTGGHYARCTVHSRGSQYIQRSRQIVAVAFGHAKTNLLYKHLQYGLSQAYNILVYMMLASGSISKILM